MIFCWVQNCRLNSMFGYWRHLRKIYLISNVHRYRQIVGWKCIEFNKSHRKFKGFSKSHRKCGHSFVDLVVFNELALTDFCWIEIFWIRYLDWFGQNSLHLKLLSIQSIRNEWLISIPENASNLLIRLDL